jgi:hypothetical protein
MSRLAKPAPESDPPSPERVARRAQVLLAVTARSLLERLPERFREIPRLRGWLVRHELWSEAEPPELALLQAAPGALSERATIDGAWRAEGVAVLAWALGEAALPPHDEPAEPGAYRAALGFLTDVLPTAPRPRSSSELRAFADRAFALHWRLRDHTLDPSPMDFEEVARTAWFGPLNIEGLPLIEGDLAIGGVAIHRADPGLVRRATSIARERHHAANWLRGDADLYSRIETST